MHKLFITIAQCRCILQNTCHNTITNRLVPLFCIDRLQKPSIENATVVRKRTHAPVITCADSKRQGDRDKGIPHGRYARV